MRLGEVLYSVWRADEVMEGDHRDPVLDRADMHAGDLEMGLVNERGIGTAGVERFETEPRLDDEQTARLDVTAHVLNRAHQPLPGLDVGKRREQAGDNTKAPAEVELRHIGTVKGDAGAFSLSRFQHIGIDVQSFHIIFLAEKGQVPSRPTGNIEEAIAQAALVL